MTSAISAISPIGPCASRIEMPMNGSWPTSSLTSPNLSLTTHSCRQRENNIRLDDFIWRACHLRISSHGLKDTISGMASKGGASDRISPFLSFFPSNVSSRRRNVPSLIPQRAEKAGSHARGMDTQKSAKDSNCGKRVGQRQ